MAPRRKEAILSTRRFDGRADVYSKNRPRYPGEVVRTLEREIGFDGDKVVADIGSGTGILSRLFLRNGNNVFCVEPNKDMREVAERNLRKYLPRFISVVGTAEATGLGSHTIDLVTVGQALHWFDFDRARDEFLRILKRDGHFMVAYNTRRKKGRVEEAYARVRDRFADRMADIVDVDDAFVSRFLGNDDFKKFEIPNSKSFDYKGMLGLLASASYMPPRGSPEWREVEKGIGRIFWGFDRNQRLLIHYDTTLYLGRISAS